MTRRGRSARVTFALDRSPTPSSLQPTRGCRCRVLVQLRRSDGHLAFVGPRRQPARTHPPSRAHARAHLEALEHAAEILAEAPRSVAADVARILDRRRAARLLDLADPAHDLESALIRISEALSLAPDWERPRLALARALDAAGRFDEMLRHCAAWCSAAPTSASAWVMLAAARLRTNDIEGCADALGTAAELHDDVPSLMDLEEVFDDREAYPELARFC